MRITVSRGPVAPALDKELTAVLGHPPPAGLRSRHRDEVIVAAHQLVCTGWDAREAQLGPELGSAFARRIMLQVLDKRWREHLAAMDDLQAAMPRKPTRGDPLHFYQRGAAELFADLQYLIHQDTLDYCLHAQIEEIES